mgnify:CR=1 FL=1
MKRILVLIFSVLFLYCAGAVYAGTLMVGAKGWYTYHDSFMNEYVAERTEESLIDGGLTSASSSTEAGNGTLLGGVVGYQADDQNWAVSMAFLFYSKFSNSIETNGTSGGLPVVDVKFDIDEERQDYDFAVTYSLSDYLKVFGGVKYMFLKYTMDELIDYNQVYLPATPDERYQVVVKSQYILPTAGIGLSYPLNPNLVVGIQAGLLYVWGEYETRFEMGNTETGELDPALGYNAEASITIVIGQSILLQAGLRIQSFNVKESNGEFDSWDTNRGVTFGVLYLVSI